jgi:hypothetical protein
MHLQEDNGESNRPRSVQRDRFRVWGLGVLHVTPGLCEGVERPGGPVQVADVQEESADERESRQ